MIKAILVFNNHGKPRLSKFYQYFVSWICQCLSNVYPYWILVPDRGYATTDNQRDVPAGIETRRQRVQFPGRWKVIVPSLAHGNAIHLLFSFVSSLIGGSDYKLIYRHYATLYFVFCVDSSESELGILDLIQVCKSLPCTVPVTPGVIIRRCSWKRWINVSRMCAS